VLLEVEKVWFKL